MLPSLKTLALQVWLIASTAALLVCTWQLYETYTAFWDWAPRIEQRLGHMEQRMAGMLAKEKEQ